MAKISAGICDNLLVSISYQGYVIPFLNPQTCVVRAWDPARPLLFCPAMNTYMWEHPLTAAQLKTLEQFGYHQIPPINKTLACGDTGIKDS